MIARREAGLGDPPSLDVALRASADSVHRDLNLPLPGPRHKLAPFQVEGLLVRLGQEQEEDAPRPKGHREGGSRRGKTLLGHAAAEGRSLDPREVLVEEERGSGTAEGLDLAKIQVARRSGAAVRDRRDLDPVVRVEEEEITPASEGAETGEVERPARCVLREEVPEEARPGEDARLLDRAQVALSLPNEVRESLK